ncbi:uncharacterized protein [Penaeus vannamei]|uniref:uncharacterized protein n=1 Tax=Penaeus vannamei TaxID=6689 RepID=UPI00387F5A65
MGPPSEEEVKSALIGLLKIASVCSISVGIVVAVCGVLAVSVVGGLTTPIIIGSVQTAVGVLFVAAGGFGYNRYRNYRRAQKVAMATRAQELALGYGSQTAIIDMLGFGPPVLALVPTDGSVLEAAVGSNSGDEEELKDLVVKLRPGLMLIQGLRGRDGRPVAVCMQNLYDGPVRFYPGMSPYHLFTIILVTLGMTFVSSVVLALAVSFPFDASVATNCGALGGFGGALLLLAACSGFQVHGAYAKGRRQQDSG